MKTKKVIAIVLTAVMLVSMVIGVSAAEEDKVIRDAVEGDAVPPTGAVDVDVEGIIEPAENKSSDDVLRPTDPTGTSDISSGWTDPAVDDSSQLLVSAPAKLKFVISGKGTDYDEARLVGGESVSGVIRNASAYIPAGNGTVRPKFVTVDVDAINPDGSSEFHLHPNTADQTVMENFGALKGSVQGIDLQLNDTRIDFGAANNTSLGDLKKGDLTSDNGVYPSDNPIKFAAHDNLKTAFVTGQKGRLVNNYKLKLTFTYKQ